MLSLYLHIPFCQRRCGYCDFVTYAGQDDLISFYLDALTDEIKFYGKRTSQAQTGHLHTIYFGGGTPSLLTVRQFERLIGVIKQNFEITDNCEVTIEANPGTIYRDYLEGIRTLGVNRISLGVQSAVAEELAVLDRLHGFSEVQKGIAAVREAGFMNLSLDLIFGIPGQSVKSWMESLQAAISFQPEHLSLYSLTVEPGTPLERKVKAGVVEAPDEDLAADMYDLARKKLGGLGYQHYEISNWGLFRDGRALVSRHNQQYWRNLPYLGVGAGAHGFFGGKRYGNEPSLVAYIHKLGSNADSETSPVVVQQEKISREREMNETLMMGLRLLQEGVSADIFAERFGEQLVDIFGQKIDRYIKLGLLEWANGEMKAIRLTPRGYLLGNQVFSAFV